MLVKDFLNLLKDDIEEIQVCATYKHGLVTVYKGEIGILKEILKVSEILEKKNWGSLNANTCFLLREVEFISPDKYTIFISIKMPDTYEHKDKNGNRLDEFV